MIEHWSVSCPCCDAPLRDKPIHNAKSRYADVYICTDCGVHEALNGNFCFRSAAMITLAREEQKRWRAYHHAAV